jgi:acylphosphatase
MRKSKRYLISGMVQGVGFRYFAQRAARRLDLTGYVRNLRDGRVEVLATGEEKSLEALRTELLRGPRMAEVSEVKEEEVHPEADRATEFSIERGLP